MGTWKKDGVVVTWDQVSALLETYILAIEPESSRLIAQHARSAVGEAGEGDGNTILPNDHPAKAAWLMVFGPFMVASNITYEE